MVRSRVLVLNFLWQTNRCSRTGHDHYALTTPSFLSRGTPRDLLLTFSCGMSDVAHPDDPRDIRNAPVLTRP